MLSLDDRLPPAGTVLGPYEAPLPESARQRLARALRQGEVVCLPTETVYGLAVRADLPQARQRLAALKGRDEGKPMACAVGGLSAFARAFPDAPMAALQVAGKLWPGPLTMVTTARCAETPRGCRIPDHPICAAVLAEADLPVLLTSANRAGEAAPRLVGAAHRTFGDAVALYLDGGECALGRASTVVEIFDHGFRLLREGPVEARRIREVGAHRILFVCTGNMCRSPSAAIIVRALLERAGPPSLPPGATPFEVLVASAGTHAPVGAPITPEARQALHALGYHDDGHAACAVGDVALESWDSIFVMARVHRMLLLDDFPHLASRIRLLSPWGKDIEDPIGMPFEVYTEVAKEIETACHEVLRWLKRSPLPPTTPDSSSRSRLSAH